MVRDSVQLVLSCVALTPVIYMHAQKIRQAKNSKNTTNAGRRRNSLLECGAYADTSSVSGKLTVVFSFSRLIDEW